MAHEKKREEKDDMEEWIDLHLHPVFAKDINKGFQVSGDETDSIFRAGFTVPRLPLNLMASNGSSRLFLWNSSTNAIQLIDICSSGPSSEALLASSRAKVLQPSIKIDFVVRYIAVNRSGASVLISSDNKLAVMYLHDRKPSTTSKELCRATEIGSRIYFMQKSKGLKVLHVAWHPHSDTHLGILSSDSIFRIFNLSADVEVPEQEYHLQPASSHCNLASTLQIRPLAFAFGSEHLWDTFTVFFLFSNGSVYALCPVVPFGSVFNYSGIEEIYKDAFMSGCQSSVVGSKASRNCSLAIAWLEAVFPELVNNGSDHSTEKGILPGIKAQAYTPFDASVMLQGPLPKIIDGRVNSSSEESKKPTGQALCFLYNTVSKDSFLAIGFAEGQLQVYALADELQPLWNFGCSPRLRLSNSGGVLSVAMVSEAGPIAAPDDIANIEDKFNNDKDSMSSAWTGNPPPMLQLAVVEFALATPLLQAAPLSLLSDPIIPERLYCYHGGGIDAIVLHWLPFSDLKNSVGKAPSVFPVLDTCPTQQSVPAPLLGITTLLDSFGETWLIALTPACECAVINMKTQREVPPLLIEGIKETDQKLDGSDKDTLDVISRDVLLGPRDIPVPQITLGKSLSASSIEGHSILHDHSKLLHEKYIEYAHKVYVELRHHSVRLNKAVDDQWQRLADLQDKLQAIQKKDAELIQRIRHALSFNSNLEERLKMFSNLPGIKEKPLTAAERDFKTLIDMIGNEDLNAMHSAIDVLSARFERYMRLSEPPSKNSPVQKVRSRNAPVPDTQMVRLKAALEKLSKIVADTTKKVNLVEDALRRKESIAD